MSLFTIKLQRFFYSTKGLRYFFYSRFLVAFFFGFNFLYYYRYNITILEEIYGDNALTLIFSPIFLFGLVAIIYSWWRREGKFIPFVLVLMFLPSTIFSPYGLVADFNLIAIWYYFNFEKKHRKRAVAALSAYDKIYSPLFMDRQRASQDKINGKAIKREMMILELLDKEDFELISEKQVRFKNLEKGIADKYMIRSFKIRGIIGKTTIVDDLLVYPESKSIKTILRPSTAD